MDVDIGEIMLHVRAADGGTLVSPQAMREIVSAVLRAVEEQQAHRDRVRSERRVSGGVAEEREAED